MRSLGIDFGERRVGLAISDPEGRVAVPLRTVERESDRSLVRRLASLCREEGVEQLVLGHPRGLDGHRGAAARRVERFAERLARATGLPFRLEDESLTSREAENRVAAAGSGRRRGARPDLDAVAAQIVLQSHLDRGEG
ncbi:MAG: Holliday junction resolvase RuvX [Thermoanaerobaculia bacterium]|nr:Holliday junction resolvase RuvX [Thermoanaerobaculia bacterium]